MYGLKQAAAVAAASLSRGGPSTIDGVRGTRILRPRRSTHSLMSRTRIRTNISTLVRPRTPVPIRFAAAVAAAVPRGRCRCQCHHRFSSSSLFRSAEQRKRKKAIRRWAVKLKQQEEHHKNIQQSRKKWPFLLTQKFPPAPQNIMPLTPFKTPPPDANWKVWVWLRKNAPILILNVGSICSFLSFTRSDIMELRALSVTGSLSAVLYFVSRQPAVLAPAIWASIFATTNCYMMYGVYEERKGRPKLEFSSEDEAAYEEHFLPHGVTPRQYEKLLHIRTQRVLSDGEILAATGEPVTKVYLVVQGGTTAVSPTVNHRRRQVVTVASSRAGNRERYAGGDAGAWIGELAFFDYVQQQQQTRTTPPRPFDASSSLPAPLSPPQNTTRTDAAALVSIPKKSTGATNHESTIDATATVAAMATPPTTTTTTRIAHKTDASNSSSSSDTDTNTQATSSANEDEETRMLASLNPTRIPKQYILTYTARQEATLVFEWEFEDLAKLLTTSAELRSSVSRAMTAAVIGKVLNFYQPHTAAAAAVHNTNTGGWKKWLFEDQFFSNPFVPFGKATTPTTTTPTTVNSNKGNIPATSNTSTTGTDTDDMVPTVGA